MGISEEKMKIVINNYFNDECTVNTSIREAFEKGFKLGVKKTMCITDVKKKGKWIHWTDDIKDYVHCSECEYGIEGEVFLEDKTPYCPMCGAEMEVEE